MSIQSEITRISGNVSDSLDAVAAKGVAVPSDSTSDDLPTLIAAIQQGGSVDVPVFTLTQNAYGTVLSITCDKTYAQCAQLLENKGTYAAVLRIDPTYTADDMFYGLCDGYTDYDSTPYASYGPVFRDDGLYDIKYRNNGNIELISSEFYGEEGTPIATKGAVSNHSMTVTPSVVNTRGFIEGNTTITGTPVTVSASELVSGSETKTANGTYDVTNLAQLVVNVSGGGGGSWTKVYSGEHSVSTTSTSRGTVTTLNIDGIYDTYKTVYVSIKDKAGARNGYFYGTISIVTNNEKILGGSGNQSFAYTAVWAYTSDGNWKCNSTSYGVYAGLTNSLNQLVIYKRYNSNYTLTINGTYLIEVFVSDLPNSFAPFG